MGNKIDIGNLIGKRLIEVGMTKAEFARRINYSRGTVYNILNNSTIDVVRLQKISIVLEFNFLELYKE